jgi:hypothetical protein
VFLLDAAEQAAAAVNPAAVTWCRDADSAAVLAAERRGVGQTDDAPGRVRVAEDPFFMLCRTKCPILRSSRSSFPAERVGVASVARR